MSEAYAEDLRNSRDDPEERDAEVGGIAADRLRSLVERYERLDQEVAAIRGDQKDLLTEAASAGFDKKVLKQIITIRKRDPAKVEEEQALFDLYMRALGS